MLLTTSGVESENKVVAADLIDDNILICSIDGPITPDRVTLALKTMVLLFHRIRENNVRYGTILHFDKDATIFHDAIILWSMVTTDFHLRKCVVFVFEKDLQGSMATAMLLKEVYANRVNVPFEIFANDVDAIDWIRSKLI